MPKACNAVTPGLGPLLNGWRDILGFGEFKADISGAKYRPVAGFFRPDRPQRAAKNSRPFDMQSHGLTFQTIDEHRYLFKSSPDCATLGNTGVTNDRNKLQYIQAKAARCNPHRDGRHDPSRG